MSRTLDASLDDPATSFEDQARDMLAAARAERRALGASLREKGLGLVEAGQRLVERADALDPQPVPFDRIRVGDHVLLDETQWVRVIQKETVSTPEPETSTTRLCVTEGGRTGYWVTVEPGELLTRGAF